MEEAIRNFPKQFEWDPKIENAHALVQKEINIVNGMGGSHLAADLLQAFDFSLDIVVQSDYDLSLLPESVLKNNLVIANSYSGNTEETLSVFEGAINKKIPVAAISTGGKLLELAKKYSVPYIQIPDTKIQPRSAVGFSFLALAKMIGKDHIIQEARGLVSLLSEQNENLETQGKALAEKCYNKVPIIYSSTRNRSIAYNWKIKFNETGKIPAFYNVVPELNHNEMTGFDAQENTRELSAKFLFILLEDQDDDPKIQKRMSALKKLYEQRNLKIEVVDIKGSSRLHKLFSSLLLADWVAYYTALHYGVDPEQVPMVEEFKKLMQ